KQIVLQGEDSISLIRETAVQVFAMVQTLGREENLSRIDKHFFDYIIVDEFHHAVANTYARVLSHFEPRYLLGMTATPERTDGQDVLALCDREVAYEVRLLEAVDRGWLVPFQYYALHDPTDYDQVRWTGTGYDEEELEALLSEDTRADLIVTNLDRYQPAAGSRKVLAFCSNVGHAQWMARAFGARGLTAATVTGETEDTERSDLIRRLEDDEDPLEILCAVDVLSEGVDIPSVTHVLLLRPTHSFTVFFQQLGRGLRLHPSKSFVVVLDFVGNYKKSYVAPLALNGCFTLPERVGRAHLPSEFKPPKGCFVDADTEVTRIWRDELVRLDPRHRKLVQIEVALEEIANGERPLWEVRLPELFTFSVRKGEKGEGRDLAPVIRSLGGWLRVRNELNTISDYGRSLLDTPGERFLKHVEEELKPNKSYKMAVLRTLLRLAEEAEDSGGVESRWSVAEIAPGFLNYYLANRRRIADWADLAREDDPEAYSMSKVIAHLKNMPLNRLSNSSKKLFVLDGDEFKLKEEYSPYWEHGDFRALLAERVEYAEARYWYTH
ncbi:MAG: DEAD/DEAH box helicase, partial [Spirochaetaceae bacterium]